MNMFRYCGYFNIAMMKFGIQGYQSFAKVCVILLLFVFDRIQVGSFESVGGYF